MQAALLSLLVFLLVCFLYIHVVHQRRESNDCEVVSVPVRNSEAFSEMVGLRCPFIYTINVEGFKEALPLDALKTEEVAYSSYDASGVVTGNETCDRGIYAWSDVLGTYEMRTCIRDMDKLCAPYAKVSSDVLVVIPSLTTVAPPRRNTHCRTLIVCASGALKVRLWSPVSGRRLAYHYDAARESHIASDTDFTKSTVECIIREGDVLCIPSRWWHSIITEDEGIALVFRYRSMSNALANIVDVGRTILSKHQVGGQLAKSVLGGVCKIE
jgi:hypothetical protein